MKKLNALTKIGMLLWVLGFVGSYAVIELYAGTSEPRNAPTKVRAQKQALALSMVGAVLMTVGLALAARRRDAVGHLPSREDVVSA